MAGNQRDAARASRLVPQYGNCTTLAPHSIELDLSHALSAADRREQRELVTVFERRVERNDAPVAREARRAAELLERAVAFSQRCPCIAYARPGRQRKGELTGCEQFAQARECEHPHTQ